MRTSRRPVSAAGLAIGLTALAVAASGCSVASPAVITTPYAASDGSNAEVGTVLLRNFLVVAADQGKPGVLVGAVATSGTSDVPVQLTVLDADGRTSLGEAKVTAVPRQLVTIGTGSDATAFTIDEVPVKPGGHLTLRASTQEGNRDFPVPVLATEHQYESVTPAASSAG